MFGIGNLPTGDKDPFALRRHALGVIRMLVEWELRLDLVSLINTVYGEFRELLPAPALRPSNEPCTEQMEALIQFIYERFAGSLRDQGYRTQDVDAVLSLRPQRLSQVPRLLAAVQAFARLPEAPALAAANKRIGNILKKSDADVPAVVDDQLLVEPAEQALHAAMQATVPTANAQFEAGDYTASLQTLAALRAPVDAFFEGVMVNADDPALKANRLGLLKSLHEAMNRVADLSRLAA
jgi:glycyl-tRNA synthetase beta chain